MSDNGHTSQIVVDLNQITRRQFREFRQALGMAGEDTEAREAALAEFYVQVITSWPYGDAITTEVYFDLGLLDAREVDEAVNNAINIIGEKK